jgi:hypothetical protein
VASGHHGRGHGQTNKTRRGRRGHKTQREFQLRQLEVINAHTWSGKGAGPTSVIRERRNVGLLRYQKLSELTIQSIYKRKVAHMMKSPECAKTWRAKLSRDDLLWDIIWKQKSMYTTPRDQNTNHAPPAQKPLGSAAWGMRSHNMRSNGVPTAGISTTPRRVFIHEQNNSGSL